MSQATAHTVTTGLIEAKNGKRYPDDTYHESSRATGNQQWVADKWADGALPCHSTAGSRVMLYTSTRNFRGYQYPDSRGLLKHYSHIEAIRTYSGLIISDTECYSKGWAVCSTPNNPTTDARLSLTSLKDELLSENEDIYDITDVQGDVVTFESGRVFDTDSWGWVRAVPDSVCSNALGR